MKHLLITTLRFTLIQILLLLPVGFEQFMVSPAFSSEADLEGLERIHPPHVAEAIQYRGLDRRNLL